MELLRILVADDYPAVRRAIRRLLSAVPNWKVVAEADNGLDAVRLSIEHAPDLVILDAAMPGLNGIEATRQIVEAAPGTRVLMLSVYDDDPYVIEALEAGANGYVLKEAADLELVQAAGDVMRGRRFVSPELMFVAPAKYVPLDN